MLASSSAYKKYIIIITLIILVVLQFSYILITTDLPQFLKATAPSNWAQVLQTNMLEISLLIYLLFAVNNQLRKGRRKTILFFFFFLKNRQKWCDKLFKTNSSLQELLWNWNSFLQGSNIIIIFYLIMNNFYKATLC